MAFVSFYLLILLTLLPIKARVALAVPSILATILLVTHAPIVAAFNSSVLVSPAFVAGLVVYAIVASAALALGATVGAAVSELAAAVALLGAALLASRTLLTSFFIVELSAMAAFILMVLMLEPRLAPVSAPASYWALSSLTVIFWVSLLSSLLLFGGAAALLLELGAGRPLLVASAPLLLMSGFFIKAGFPPLFLWKINFFRGLTLPFLSLYALLYYLTNLCFLFFNLIPNLLLPASALSAGAAVAGFAVLFTIFNEVAHTRTFLAVSSLLNACLVLFLYLTSQSHVPF